MGFLEFVSISLSRTPKWWWLVTGTLATVSFVLTLRGDTPKWISEHWCWWFLLVVSLFYSGSMWGAFRMWKELEYWLLYEYVAMVSKLHKPNTLWNKAHENAIASQIDGEKKLIGKAIGIVRDGKQLIKPPFLL